MLRKNLKEKNFSTQKCLKIAQGAAFLAETLVNMHFCGGMVELITNDGWGYEQSLSGRQSTNVYLTFHLSFQQYNVWLVPYTHYGLLYRPDCRKWLEIKLKLCRKNASKMKKINFRKIVSNRPRMLSEHPKMFNKLQRHVFDDF